MVLGATGFSLGLLLQGARMINTVDKLMPTATIPFRAEALIVAIIIFLAAYLVRVPMSVNMSLVGLLAGVSMGMGTLTDHSYLVQTIGLWIAAPLFAVFFAFYLIKFLSTRQPKNFWRRIQTYKVLLIILASSSSYVLGANTLGLIVAVGGFDLPTLIISVGAAFVGVSFFSSGQIRRVSQELFLMRYPNATAALVTSTVLVEAATLLNIPLSNTQALSSSIFATGISYKFKLVSLKPFLLTVLAWIITPILSFIVGFTIATT
jgi:inorganic phosphate transporter, PiT family